MLAYFSSLREAASSAAAPASRTDPVTQDSAKGQVTVTSQHNDLPLCHGTSVRPSGLFPSVRRLLAVRETAVTLWRVVERPRKRCSGSMFGCCPDGETAAPSAYHGGCPSTYFFVYGLKARSQHTN